MRIVRIFVSSPGDTLDERRRVVRVVERLNAAYSNDAKFEAVLWEDKFYSAHEGFQPQIARSVDCDIVVAILRGRIGTPLPTDFISSAPAEGGVADEQNYLSGTAYEILTAIAARRAGKRLPDIFVFRYPYAPSVALDAADRADIEAQWKSLKAFAEHVFVDPQGHFKGAYQSFISTDDFETKVEGALRQWLSENVLEGRAVVWPISSKGSPFRGLEPFGAKHADVFFGRSEARTRAIERLKNTADAGYPFMLVVGPSGSGKSSFVRAGMVPWLVKPGAVTGIDAWRVAQVRPGENPNGPIAAVTQHLFDDRADIVEAEEGRPAALPELRRGDYSTPAALAGLLSAFASAHFERPDDLAAASTAAVAPIARALMLAGDREQQQWGGTQHLSVRLLLIIDQFEELFSPDFDDALRSGFARILDCVLRTGLVWVIGTLRSETFDAFLRSSLSRLASAAETGSLAPTTSNVDPIFRLLPPGLSEIAEVVRGPATAAGLSWDVDTDTRQGLDERLIGDIDRPDLLPLVQFVLGRLFEKREVIDGKVTLTYAAYRALGRLDGAINQEAERAVSTLSAAELAALPRLLRSLVTYGAAGQGAATASPILRSAPLEQVAYDAPSRRLVEALVQARILVSGADAGGRHISLAHQRVIEAWQRAKSLVAESEALLRVRAEVEDGKQRWQNSGQRRDRLIPPGLPLTEAEHAAETLGQELPADTRGYIDRSGRAARLRQRLVALAAAVLLVLSIAAVWEGVSARRSAAEAEAQRDQAEQQKKIALANEAEAKRQQRAADNAFQIGFHSYRRTFYRYLAEGNFAQCLKELAAEEALVAGRTKGYSNADNPFSDLTSFIDQDYGVLFNLQGKYSDALPRWRRAHDLLLPIVRKTPNDPTLHDLGSATLRSQLLSIADAEDITLSNLGRPQDALKQLIAARQFEKSLPPDASKNPGLKKSLADVDIDIGDALRVAKRDAEAVAFYAEARLLLISLTEKRTIDNGDVSRLDSLAKAELALGDIDVAGKRLSDAVQHYDGAAAAVRRSLEGSLNSTMLEVRKRNDKLSDDLASLVIADEKLAQPWLAIGNVAKAVASYDDALQVLDSVAPKWPSDSPTQIQLGFAYTRIGADMDRIKESDKAIAIYKKAVAIDNGVIAKEPNNKQALNNNCAILESWGDDLAGQKKFDEALPVYQTSLAAANRLVALDPSNVPNVRVAANIDLKVGYLLLQKAALEDALKTYEAAVDLLKPLLSGKPDESTTKGAVTAYFYRGYILQRQGQFDRSIADYTQSLTLNPKVAGGYIQRGVAHLFKGDLTSAISDYDQAIALGPAVQIYVMRSIAYFYSGAPSRALADLDQAAKLNPTNAYVAIWRSIINQRSGSPPTLRQDAARVDMTKWPAPIIRLSLGELSADQVLKAADAPDAVIKTLQVCQSEEFLGLMSAQNNKTGAVHYLESAVTDCPKNELDSAFVSLALKTLNASLR